MQIPLKPSMFLPARSILRTRLPMQETQGTWLSWEDPLEENVAATPEFLPRESHGQGSLVGYSPLSHSDMTERLTLSFLQLYYYMA